MLKPQPFLHLDNQLCFSIYSLSRQITQAYQPLLKPLGLTYPQYLVLLVLWQAAEENQPALTVSFLCQRLLLDTGTVTPLLKRMEAAGLLQRRRAATDERVVEVSLTEAGLDLRQAATAIPQQILCATGVDVSEAQSLKQRLGALLNRWLGRRSQVPTASARPESAPD